MSQYKNSSRQLKIFREPNTVMRADGRKRTSLDRLSRIVANIAGEEGGVAVPAPPPQTAEQHASEQAESGEAEKKLAVLL
ncbi:hypothetical protein Y032_0024g955 [Ancylostoma ceylanicum]|uniref:Uncharacterized protein n=1 Tax=Ancylostoma ceylanicum TaxID=53326 RepID=A0A016UXX0_9BILA|nr:hypothetical protein Y032_0024g955 [Ancylostoma ceylanicum]